MTSPKSASDLDHVRSDAPDAKATLGITPPADPSTRVILTTCVIGIQDTDSLGPDTACHWEIKD